METKPLLYGLIGFMLGGLLVSVVATTNQNNTTMGTGNSMSMDGMTRSLEQKTGDDYDAAFIAYMIEHHESAVDMAKLSPANAKHQEIKDLSTDIVQAQQREIEQMRQWQKDWSYKETTGSDSRMMH